jgi:hypothetical protein
LASTTKTIPVDVLVAMLADALTDAIDILVVPTVFDVYVCLLDFDGSGNASFQFDGPPPRLVVRLMLLVQPMLNVGLDHCQSGDRLIVLLGFAVVVVVRRTNRLTN